MRVLDYIIKAKKRAFIFRSQVPIVREEVKKLLSNKYNKLEFDSELLDLIEIYDKVNGG